jgi:Tol biopolymer transport system component
VLAFALSAGYLATAQEITTRMSVDSQGNQANNQSQFWIGQAISADGRFVAFLSYATNLVPGDTNHVEDIFVHDRLTGETTRVSVDSQGNQANSYSGYFTISTDGRYTAFESQATNLVSGDTNGTYDVFVHDRQTGETTRVSVDSSGNQGDSGSGGPSISADGRYLAFASWASNLVPGDTNNGADIFVHDRLTGETRRVSVDSQGNQGDGDKYGFWAPPSISADGRYVAFDSSADNLVPGDTNNATDIFVHDSLTGETTRVSVDSRGEQGDDSSIMASISADGRFVAFTSWATNFISPEKAHGSTSNITQVFIHDRQTGETTLASVNSAGIPGDSSSDYASISADGRLVAFHSYARNFDHRRRVDWPIGDDVFVHDRQTGETTLVSVNSAEFAGNVASWNPSISADGRYVAFESYATNLVPGDTNLKDDIFVHGPELVLEADPVVVSVGQTLTLTVYKGVADNPTSLWAVAVDGSPAFSLVAIGHFGSDGKYVLSGIVPQAIAGNVITFRGYASGQSGFVVATNDVMVSFQ